MKINKKPILMIENELSFTHVTTPERALKITE